MAEKQTRIGAEEGLHARPASLFVKKAKEFTSDITVIKGDKEANAKSPLKVMSLGAKKDDEVTIRAEGDDAEEAVEALAALASQSEH